MSNVLKRAVTGAGIVAVIVCSLLYGPYTFFFLCAAITLLGLQEFYRLFGISKRWLMSATGFLLWFTLFVSLFRFTFHDDGWRVWLISIPSFSFVFLTVLFGRYEAPFSGIALTFLGHVYITFPFILLFVSGYALNGEVFNGGVILGYFFLLWANDTGAYVSGSMLGKHPLAPIISPKKTWEGTVGGALLVLSVSFVNHYFFGDLSLRDWLALGVMVIVMGTLGDLVKSVMKRSLRIKDSGTILPGHGGILDRFDSLIGSVPFVFAYLSILP